MKRCRNRSASLMEGHGDNRASCTSDFLELDLGCGSILLRLSSPEHFFDDHGTFFFPDLHIYMQCISDISINI